MSIPIASKTRPKNCGDFQFFHHRKWGETHTYIYRMIKGKWFYAAVYVNGKELRVMNDYVGSYSYPTKNNGFYPCAPINFDHTLINYGTSDE